MTEITDTHRRLWHSLELHCIRRELILYLLAIGVFLLMTRGNRIIGLLLACAGFGPFVVFHLWRTVQIFRRPEDYTFHRAVLSQPHQKWPLKAMYFTVWLEESDGSKSVADTHAIFACHGIVEPLVESYVNSTVTIARNTQTGMVVVIG